MTLKHYQNLDGLRGIAALMILIFHFFALNGSDETFYQIMKKVSIIGKTGVTMFFVLSGFLITRILLHTKFNSNYFSVFYIRRALRIFPLYYLFLFIYYFSYPFLFGNPVASFSDQSVYYLYLQSIAITFNWETEGPGHFWSLSVEEHFYLIWPLFIYFLPIKHLKSVIYLIIAFSFFSRIYLLNLGYDVFYFSLSNFDAMVFGALIAITERENLLNPHKNIQNLKRLILSVIVTAIVFVAFINQEIAIIRSLKYTLISSVYFFAIIYLICADESNALNKILKLRPLKFIGKVSYGIYVYHIFVIQLVKDYLNFKNWELNLILVIIFTALISSLSYYLFESQFLKFKRYYRYSNQKTVNPSA